MHIFILQKCDNGCCYCSDIIGIFYSLEEAKLFGNDYLRNNKCTIEIQEWIMGQKLPLRNWFRHNIQESDIGWSDN